MALYLTRKEIKEYWKELQELKTSGRQEIARKLKHAREYGGNLAVNTEYDAVKAEQKELEDRISQLDKMLVVDLMLPPVDGSEREITTDRYTISSLWYDAHYKIDYSRYCDEDNRVDYSILDSHRKRICIGIHGFAGDKESSALRALADELNKDGDILVSFDFPCHGTSPVGEKQLTIKNCMQDVLDMAELIRKEYPDYEKCIFATSFGGFIALLCEDQLKDFKMVLRAPAVTMPEHILLDLIGMTPEEFKAHGPVQCGFEGERSLMLPYEFYEELQNYSVMNRIFDREMLIIHGNVDDVVPHEDIIAFCRNNPKIMLKVIKGADHRFKKPGELDSVIQDSIDYWRDLL